MVGVPLADPPFFPSGVVIASPLFYFLYFFFYPFTVGLRHASDIVRIANRFVFTIIFPFFFFPFFFFSHSVMT